MHDAPKSIQVPRFKNGQWHVIDDIVTVESPFVVTWQLTGASASENVSLSSHDRAAANSGITREVSGGVESCTIWAWPNDLAPLALGHVLLDKAPARHCLHREASVSVKGEGSPKNNAPATQSESSFHVVIGNELPGLPPAAPVSWESGELLSAMRDFIGAGGLWDDTGCFHRAGVYDVAAQKLLIRAEDIGRHNCLDRLAGWSVLTGTPLSDKALLISARMTSSLCAKALRAGFRIIVSRSAVTTAAIAMCAEAGATLVGFARTDEGRFTVFADSGRICRPE